MRAIAHAGAAHGRERFMGWRRSNANLAAMGRSYGAAGGGGQALAIAQNSCAVRSVS